MMIKHVVLVLSLIVIATDAVVTCKVKIGGEVKTAAFFLLHKLPYSQQYVGWYKPTNVESHIVALPAGDISDPRSSPLLLTMKAAGNKVSHYTDQKPLPVAQPKDVDNNIVATLLQLNEKLRGGLGTRARLRVKPPTCDVEDPWPDANPRGDNEKKKDAHEKGMFLQLNDGEGAAFISYSLPHFPIVTALGSVIPKSAVKFGQHVFCITANQATAPRFKTAIQLAGVLHASAAWMNEEPDNLAGWKEIACGDNPVTKVRFYTSSTYGVPFYLFSKASGKDDTQVKADLWEAAGVVLEQKLKVHTWIDTGDNKLQNGVKSEAWGDKKKTFGVKEFEFKDRSDHSKWGYGGDYVCVGGSNRETTQLKRGGILVCIENPELKNKVAAYRNP